MEKASAQAGSSSLAPHPHPFPYKQAGEAYSSLNDLASGWGQEAARSHQHLFSLDFKIFEMTLTSSWVSCEFQAIAHSVWVDD